MPRASCCIQHGRGVDFPRSLHGVFQRSPFRFQGHGYAMLQDFADLTNADFFNNVKLPLNRPEYLKELDGRTPFQS